jgi:predicted O-linked N-acetylglucosamine transferase (SPINDLY family)
VIERGSTVLHRSGFDLSRGFQQAASFQAQGRLWEAERLFELVLKADDRHFESLYRLGLIRLQQRRFGDAEHLFRRAVEVDKSSADAHQFLGFALTGLARLEEAIRSYQKAIALRPRFAEAYNNLGYALQVLGRLDEAIAQYEKAIAIRPDYHEAHNNLGNVLHLLNRSEEAIACYRKALEIKPDYAEADWNLGTAFRAIGRLEEAIAHYEKAIAIRPDYHEAYNSLGNTLWHLNRLEEAIAKYEKALALKPDYVQAHINYGDVLAALDRGEAAIAAYDAALALKPNDASVLAKRGDIFVRLHRYPEAFASFEAALAADPDNDHAFSGLAACANKACDWTRTASVARELPARIAKGRFIHPFDFLAYSSDAALQLACAERYARDQVPVRPTPLWTDRTWRNPKIKIAYVATGFHTHPTAYLIAELMEVHDRSCFEIVGVSLGPDDKSEIRARLIRAFDQFYDARGKSDREVAVQLHEMQVDIAVDCSGYITDARPGIFALRPVPIQVSYLAYPGTLGANFYDYIIADPTVLPFDQQPFYGEKIVHLPGCYQPNDSKRAIAVQTPTREHAGLPARGFVFCCFNNNYKITAPIFDIWMRLLGRVEGSMLWLLCERATAESNLRREAAARGIDPSRLVFARRVPLEDHLARHRLADLFLDTLPYNAHTTASDALWAGLPVLTCCGQTFAGRVAASLLRAIGMPDLVTDDLDAYERLALRLASESSVLDKLRDRLRRNRLAYPLFDTDRYRRHLETAYVRMWQRWQNNESPAGFAVESKHEDSFRAEASWQ